MLRAHALLRLFVATSVLLALTSLAACGPTDPLEAIRKQQASGDFEGTIEPLRKLLEKRSGDPEIQYLYGTALSMTGQTSLAEWALREAMNDPDWLQPAGLRLAYGALRTQNFPLAIETTTRILESHPDHVDALMMRANAYAHSHLDNEAALADVERILELDPDNLDVMEPRILALIAMDRIDEVAEAIEELGRRIDETQLGEGVTGWHCTTTALFAEESGDLELAEKRFSRCLEEHPGHPNLVTNALAFFDKRGDYARSLEILRNAQEVAPSREYRLMLADRLRGVGEVDEAEQLMLEATKDEQKSLAASAWVDLAKHYQAVNDFTAAARAAEQAVELSRPLGGPSPQLLLEAADSLLLAGELDRAEQVVAEMTLPAHREMILARVAQERGQPEVALDHFDEAFRLWPDNPWARYYAALAAEAVGDFDRALAAYRYSIRINAGATESRLRAAQLHLAEKHPMAALQLLRLDAEAKPLSVEGELLSLRLWAYLGQRDTLHTSIERLRKLAPALAGPGLAASAEGVRDRAGAEAAAKWLVRWESEGVEFADPANVEALRALTRFWGEAGKPEQAEASVRAALAATPDAAATREVRALWLELGGGKEAEAREAYEAVLEVEPDNARALAGLGRLALASDPEAALGLFDRAVAADPQDASSMLDAARALVASERQEAAEQRLDQLLAVHPYDGEAAALLAELRLSRGVVTDRTLELANRAVRFGGGEQASELLSRVQAKVGSPGGEGA